MIPNFEKIEFIKFLEKNPNRIYEGGNRFKGQTKIHNEPLISIIIALGCDLYFIL